MWRAVIFVGVLLGSGEGFGEGSDSHKIDCALLLHNPDRCVFFIEINRTLQTYFSRLTEFPKPLDIVKKVCAGSRTLNGTSVTSSQVKVQHMDELQKIAGKYPVSLSGNSDYFVLATSSDGSSSGEAKDYPIYRSLDGDTQLYFSNHSPDCDSYRVWVLGYAEVGKQYIACQVDLTPGSTPKPNAKAEGDGSKAADTEVAGQTAQTADQFSEGNYVFFFEQLPPQINVTLLKSSIECENDAKFIGSYISVSIANANCISDLRTLGINNTQSGSIERSFPSDAEIIEKCKSPQLAFIGVDRNTLSFAFLCRSWECKPPVWPTIVIAVLAVLLVGVLSGIGLFLHMDRRRDPTAAHDKSGAGETANLDKPTQTPPVTTTTQ